MKKAYKVRDEKTIVAGNTTVSSVLIEDNVFGYRFEGTGKAVCLDSDTPNPKIGRGISRDRATKKAVEKMIKLYTQNAKKLTEFIKLLNEAKNRALHDIEVIDARIAKDIDSDEAASD